MLTFYQKNAQSGDYHQTQTPQADQPILAYGKHLTVAEARQLAQDYQLPEHFLVEDLFDTNELPRIETSQSMVYIFVRNPERKGARVFSRPVLFVAGSTFFACVSSREDLPNELIGPPENSRHATPYNLMISGLMAIANRYESMLDDIGNRIERIEKLMRSHEATNHDFFDFVTIESGLNRLKMSLNGQLVIANKLLDLSKNKADREHLDDLQLFIKQLLVEVDSSLQAISSITRAYSTVANNTLNQRMKALTALTLLLALPNVFYGMYGMNIALPFMHESWAYTAVVGFTLLLVFGAYLLARKLKLF